jgi:hypothetical protein
MELIANAVEFELPDMAVSSAYRVRETSLVGEGMSQVYRENNVITESPEELQL